jgi:hypothetical protein
MLFWRNKNGKITHFVEEEGQFMVEKTFSVVERMKKVAIV